MGLVALFLVMALLSAGNRDISGWLTGDWLTPLQQFTAKGTETLRQTLSPTPATEELLAENSRLQEENRRLQDMVVDYYNIRREKEELERFYRIKREHRSFTLVPSTVIGRDPDEGFYGFTLDKGSEDGVRVNDPVMTENGLVGQVCEVSFKSCKVCTILSPEAGVGAVVSRTGDSGLLEGNVRLADEGKTRLMNLPSRHTVQVGDIVVTSGYGGTFPENIKIGQVGATILDDYTGMPAAVIEPFEDIRTLSSAVIVLESGT